MPEIDFTIDPATGKLELHVKGVAGPACENVVKVARELLGAPARERNTADYYVRPQIRPRVQPSQGAKQ